MVLLHSNRELSYCIEMNIKFDLMKLLQLDSTFWLWFANVLNLVTYCFFFQTNNFPLISLVWHYCTKKREIFWKLNNMRKNENQDWERKMNFIWYLGWAVTEDNWQHRVLSWMTIMDAQSIWFSFEHFGEMWVGGPWYP